MAVPDFHVLAPQPGPQGLAIGAEQYPVHAAQLPPSVTQEVGRQQFFLQRQAAAIFPRNGQVYYPLRRHRGMKRLHLLAATNAGLLVQLRIQQAGREASRTQGKGKVWATAP